MVREKGQLGTSKNSFLHRNEKAGNFRIKFFSILEIKDNNIRKKVKKPDDTYWEQWAVYYIYVPFSIPLSLIQLTIILMKLQLQYVDHLMQRADSLKKTLTLGKSAGKRRRD